MIKIHQLIHANALIEHGSFRKAALTQNISRPAFSRSIANLEHSLGVQLFHRHPSGVSITVYGEVLKKYINSISIELSELEREIQLIKGLGTGALTVALGCYFSQISAYQALGILISEYPELKGKALVHDYIEIERLILTKGIDLGLTEISRAKENEYLEVQSLGKHQGVFFCRSNHPLLKKEDLIGADFTPYPLVFTKVPKQIASLMPGKLYQVENQDYVLPSLEVENFSSAKQIVLESDAFGVAVPLQIESELENGQLSVLPYLAPWLVTEYGFMYLRDRALSPVAEKYIGIVRDLERKANIRNQVLLDKYVNNASLKGSLDVP
ncbi:LysR family transcriptional regulator [Desulfosediminicola ganghwensis]|uniref:LysR family transcriptional regulator n=1 Tax=Desulfosediminicola ganghwensis TaxID=2569540 RepID=UPI0010AD2C1C|nr:LysR family transcriptional regulator [Desulfosediminicola ganghwensis]